MCIVFAAVMSADRRESANTLTFTLPRFYCVVEYSIYYSSKVRLPGVDKGVADIDVTAALVVDDLAADGTMVVTAPPATLEIRAASAISLSFFSRFSFVPRMI